MARVRLSKPWLLEAMQSAVVREGLKAKRDTMAGEVQAAAAADDYYDPTTWKSGEAPALPEVTTSEGTRRGGRPYARLAIPKLDEFGDYSKPKRRILGQLAAKHNTPRGG